MNRLFAIPIALFMLATLSFSQAQPKPPTIDVTGNAEILVQPDEVVFSLDVTKRNKDMNIAKRETFRFG